MPIKIESEFDCMGCAACYNICPKNCIDMKQSNTGFEYPIVNYDSCVNCDLCIKVCPIANPIIKNDEHYKTNVFAAWSNNLETRYESTSGGIFSELAQYVFSQNGYVCGALYDDNNMVKHEIIKDLSELSKIRQSKYTQSSTGNIFREIKNLLEEGKMIFFMGTPCQVAGLKKFLNKEYELLITGDFICRGVNSAKAYLHWLKELEIKYKSKIKKVWFKYKINGWKKSPTCTRIDFVNSKICILNSKKNTFMMGYLNLNLYIRPSCSQCKFKDENRNSDLTLADFWGITEDLDDDKGTSAVIINSEKGQKLFNNIKKNITYYNQNLITVYNGNTALKNSVKINSKSKEFLLELDNVSFNKLLNKYRTKSFIIKFVNKLKYFRHKFK